MIREARPADAPAIAALESRVARRPWSERAVADALASPHALAWVAEEAAPVGYAIAQVVADEAELHLIGVAPEARRRGLGGALLAAACAGWTSRGAVRAFLEVAEDNGPARALYARTGWTEVGRRRAYYGDGVDALLLGWRV